MPVFDIYISFSTSTPNLHPTKDLLSLYTFNPHPIFM
jgi:hypothetical protein